MTIFPSTSLPRAACTWARSWSSSRASTGMTTKPDSTTLCSCASPRPTRSISPYAYCANNPVCNVDLDGKKIRFAKGVPSDFKQQFPTAIKILNEHNIGGIFAKLEQRPEIIFITEGKNQFDPSNNTIRLNPTEGMITDKLS